MPHIQINTIRSLKFRLTCASWTVPGRTMGKGGHLARTSPSVPWKRPKWGRVPPAHLATLRGQGQDPQSWQEDPELVLLLPLMERESPLVWAQGAPDLARAYWAPAQTSALRSRPTTWFITGVTSHLNVTKSCAPSPGRWTGQAGRGPSLAEGRAVTGRDAGQRGAERAPAQRKGAQAGPLRGLAPCFKDCSKKNFQ